MVQADTSRFDIAASTPSPTESGSCKTCLRSTTIMPLRVYKELADGVDMVEVANLLVGHNQQRKHLFAWEVFTKR